MFFSGISEIDQPNFCQALIFWSFLIKQKGHRKKLSSDKEEDFGQKPNLKREPVFIGIGLGINFKQK